MKKSNISPDITKKSLEEDLEKLEEIVSKIEDGSINLEEKMEEYNSGGYREKNCKSCRSR